MKKRQLAQIYTPLPLCRQMIDSVPAWFWNQPRRVLEPCAGDGIFVYQLIRKMLSCPWKPVEPDPLTKLDYIIRHCLFFCDIDGTNINLIQKELGVETTNAKIGDSLKQKWKHPFDLVITNPPFQRNRQVPSARKGGYGKTSLWGEFVSRALNKWVRPGGFFVCVHPSAWRKPFHPLGDKLKRGLLYLETHTERDGVQTFGCRIRYDWYVWQHGTPSLPWFPFLDDQGKQWRVRRYDTWPWLPNNQLDLFPSLFWKEPRNDFGVLFDRVAYGTDKPHMSMTQDTEHPFPCVHQMNSKGTRFVWSAVCNKGHFGVSKVILSAGRYQYPVIDTRGEYGMTQIAFGLRVRDEQEARQLVEALQHPVFQKVLQATKWSSFYTEWRLFLFLKRNFYTALQEIE